MADYITPQEASELSGYNTEYIRTLIRDSRIVALKKGNTWWVDRASFVNYLKAVKKTEPKDKRYGPKRKQE